MTNLLNAPDLLNVQNVQNIQNLGLTVEAPDLKPLQDGVWEYLLPHERVAITKRRAWVAHALTKVLEVLEKIPNSDFDLTTWHREGINSDNDPITKKSTCNTIGCAMGWSATTPWFTHHGLSIDQFGSVAFEDKGGFAALYHFFKLEDVYQSRILEQLFSATNYVSSRKDRVSKIRVQARIKKFIAAIVEGKFLKGKKTGAFFSQDIPNLYLKAVFEKGFNIAFLGFETENSELRNVNLNAEPIFVKGGLGLMVGDVLHYNRAGGFVESKNSQRYTTTTQGETGNVMLRRIKNTPFNEYVVVRT